MTLDDLVNDVIHEVPEAPLMTVRQMVRWAAYTLCSQADAWVVREGPIVVAADTDYPQLVVPSGAEPLRLRALETADGDALRHGVDYVQPTPGTISFLRTPPAATLYGELACRPPLDGDPPETLLRDWFQGLAHGARYRLLTLPQPWQNAETALYYHRLFQGAVHDAKQAATFGHHRGGRRVRARRFL